MRKLKTDEYGRILKILKYDFFDEPAVALVEYKGKKYKRQVYEGESSVDDWDSMYPPPPDYRYVIINKKEVIIEGAKPLSKFAGQWTPYGRRDIYGGL